MLELGSYFSQQLLKSLMNTEMLKQLKKEQQNRYKGKSYFDARKIVSEY